MTYTQANKDVAGKIYEGLKKCVKKREIFVPDELAAISFAPEMTFSDDITDAASKLLVALIEKIKCALNAMEDLLEEGELRNVYKKFRTDVEAILKNDVDQCKQTEGLVQKLK